MGRLAEEVATSVLKEKCPILAQYLFLYTKEQSLVVGEDGDKDRDKACFVDTGVYTRNRIFRLMGSMKYGKDASAALRIATSNQFPLGISNDDFYHCEGGNEYSADDDDDDDGDCRGEQVCTKDRDINQRLAKALADTFVIPIHSGVLGNYKKKKDETNAIEILPLIDQGLNTRSSRPFFGQQSKRNHGDNNQSMKSISISTRGSFTSMNHRGSSPFPALDNFVSAKLATFNGIDGSIRSWSMEDVYTSPTSNAGSATKITYQIKDNRWCEHIGRSHKSNGIMWNVSLYDMTYWQTCWDPDCRRRCSVVHDNLPDHVVNEIRDVIFEIEIKEDASFERGLVALDIDNVKGDECVRSKEDIDKAIDVDESFEIGLLNLSILNPDGNENEMNEARLRIVDGANTDHSWKVDISSDAFEGDESFERALMNLNLNI